MLQSCMAKRGGAELCVCMCLCTEDEEKEEEEEEEEEVEMAVFLCSPLNVWFAVECGFISRGSI
ncbi:hypothetical protein E2C01_067309 [Portunus trituberculatus]|uniref:Uncharacterized protein n=1 Tax=Portunus trituberculatus TaxID=210409 RepID=A0A5B7HSA1_PORTR|nr:hypothetical protein [Portunus trituberculatus]